MAVVSPMRAGSLLHSAPWRPPPLLAAPGAPLAGPLGPAAGLKQGVWLACKRGVAPSLQKAIAPKGRRSTGPVP